MTELKYTPGWVKPFLNHLKRGASVHTACGRVRITQTHVNDRRRTDEDFRHEMDEIQGGKGANFNKRVRW